MKNLGCSIGRFPLSLCSLVIAHSRGSWTCFSVFPANWWLNPKAWWLMFDVFFMSQCLNLKKGNPHIKILQRTGISILSTAEWVAGWKCGQKTQTLQWSGFCLGLSSAMCEPCGIPGKSQAPFPHLTDKNSYRSLHRIAVRVKWGHAFKQDF